jgi:hypothetical protein
MEVKSFMIRSLKLTATQHQRNKRVESTQLVGPLHPKSQRNTVVVNVRLLSFKIGGDIWSILERSSCVGTGHFKLCMDCEEQT